MARAARRGFTPRRARRAAPAWGFVGTITTITVPPQSKALIGSFILSNPPLGETILRTRFALFVASDVGTLEVQVGAFGMIVVTDRAVAAGAASIPGPFTDGGDDGWFVHQSVQQRTANAAGQLVPTIYGDSKAMRKVEDGGEIAIMYENSHATETNHILFAVRLLAKLTES